MNNYIEKYPIKDIWFCILLYVDEDTLYRWTYISAYMRKIIDDPIFKMQWSKLRRENLTLNQLESILEITNRYYVENIQLPLVYTNWMYDFFYEILILWRDNYPKRFMRIQDQHGVFLYRSLLKIDTMNDEEYASDIKLLCNYSVPYAMMLLYMRNNLPIKYLNNIYTHCVYQSTYSVVSIRLIEILCQKGVHPDTIDDNVYREFNTTPLLYIIDSFDKELGYLQIVKTLIQHGANINAKNECGDTPILLLCQYISNKKIRSFSISESRYFELLFYLLSMGADPSITNKYSYSFSEFLRHFKLKIDALSNIYISLKEHSS
jgi:hypothetical protein